MPRPTTTSRPSSLTASVTDYPIEYGRTYHRYHEGSYVYPNDEQEMDRLDMQHHMCKLLTGGRLFFAPLRNPREILDIGTGSGIWPIELASIFPEAQITGTDLSPCQPTEVPENVQFIVDDITEEEWLWEHNSLDYIHAGHLSGSLRSFKTLLQQMFDHLKPGGWAECHEFDTMVKCDDGTMPPLDEDQIGTYQFQDWCDLQIRAGHATDPPRQFRVAHRLARGMRDMGFVDVEERIFKAPVNPWSSDPHLHEIGRWNESNILQGLSGWSYKPLTTLAWSKPEIEVFLVEVRKSVQNRDVHAYLNFHASCSSSSPLFDHVWISEEQLASTFKRFANGQRRYESRVPGPLEAKRRLAKRKNTALASIAGAGPWDDVACLFGRNGREHMKWTDTSGRLDHYLSPSNSNPPTTTFYNEISGWTGPGGSLHRPEARDKMDTATRDQIFGEQLRQYRTTSDLKLALRTLNIDLRQEPRYSRLILDHLVSQVFQKEDTIRELVSFLEDPHLNVPGASNFHGAVKYCISRGTQLDTRHFLFGALIRALELGTVSSKEISAIIKDLARMAAASQDKKRLTHLYRLMWDAICRCDIYGPQDVDEATYDIWLTILKEMGTAIDYFLAKDLLSAAGLSLSVKSAWAQEFVTQWLEGRSSTRLNAQHIVLFLRPFDVDSISNVVISTTEALISSEKSRLLNRWAQCLAKLPNASAIASSSMWTDIPALPSASSNQTPHSPRHLIIQRLWLLYTMSSSLSAGFIGRRHPTTVSLYRLYESVRQGDITGLWDDLTEGIHELKLPWTDYQLLIDDLRTKGVSNNAPQRNITGHSHSTSLSFAEVFSDVHRYDALRPIFFSNVDRLIRQINVTSPAFREHALHVARAGDSLQVWTLVRLLRSHTPLKIALARSWPGSAVAQVDPAKRISTNTPHPQEALELIHSLATAFACSEQLSPRRAFKLVRWLFVYLLKHSAPVRPEIARAMYHAGVVRFRKSGKRVAMAQYRYIWAIVLETEDPDTVHGILGRTVSPAERKRYLARDNLGESEQY
ncbi:hypothetical protein BJX61DRAFT_530745 [Aspergillus egyptiacus]|nr:hypothetical protein BJX61DRAFT_530745 [Aspergillus egyptiacus]